MAHTRLSHPTTQPAKLISVLAYQVVVRTATFFQQLSHRRQHTPGKPLTRAEKINEIVRSRRCICGGTCPSCRNIIRDVIGD